MQWLEGRADESGTVAADPAERSSDREARGWTTLTIAARLKRVGCEMRLLVEGANESQAPDASLTRILVRAHAIRDRLLQDSSLTVEELARREDLVPSYVTRLLRLTYLAPDIISGLMSGQHPPELTVRKLMTDTRLPLD